MFDHNTNANETVSRRNVLKKTGGFVAGSTVLAGLGAGRGAAETEESLQIKVREMNEDYIAVDVFIPEAVYSNDMELQEVAFLGHSERFVIHEDGEWVSLPEDTEALTRPVAMDFDNPHDVAMYFRTEDVDLSEATGKEVMVGLGLFPERTVPGDHWNACPGHRDY